MQAKHQMMVKKLIEEHQCATVVGLGLTGHSVVRYLISCGLQVSVVDTRQNPPFIEDLKKYKTITKKHFGSLDSPLIHQASLLVVSPGVALDQKDIHIARENGARIIGDIELFVEANTKPVIGITGSNGKSTVTTLVGKMCEAGGYKPLVAGNIGLPALNALTDSVEYDIAVLELSSFQLETITQLNADSVAILNVSADHLDRYRSMGDYLLAKAKILKGAKSIVLPRHDEALMQITVKTEGLLSFDLDEPSNNGADCNFGIKRMSNYRWLFKDNERLMKLRDIPLTGLHNVKNVLAAFALVDFLQIDNNALSDAVKNFKGLPHRMQTVADLNDVTWVNDSKATNIGATVTALIGIEQDIVWIAGGQGKGANFEELRSAVQPHIKHLILYGEDASEIESALDGLLPIIHASGLDEAVTIAYQMSTKGSVVLLSPACASMDMFRDFKHRGDHFVDCVKNVAGDKTQSCNSDQGSSVDG